MVSTRPAGRVQLLYPHPRSYILTPLVPGDKSFEAAEIASGGGGGLTVEEGMGELARSLSQAVVPLSRSSRFYRLQ
ncbi:hypothetical protein CEP53_006999 [Fusarium sp. AF-6]|nr:hypothetical protein CEP53_006999 [Fusarium sp. AF-6]